MNLKYKHYATIVLLVAALSLSGCDIFGKKDADLRQDELPLEQQISAEEDRANSLLIIDEVARGFKALGINDWDFDTEVPDNKYILNISTDNQTGHCCTGVLAGRGDTSGITQQQVRDIFGGAVAKYGYTQEFLLADAENELSFDFQNPAFGGVWGITLLGPNGLRIIHRSGWLPIKSMEIAQEEPVLTLP